MRLCDHAVQVPAVLRVLLRASDQVHRQSVGHYGYDTETGMLLVLTAQKTVDSSCSSWLVLHKLSCNDRCRGG